MSDAQVIAPIPLDLLAVDPSIRSPGAALFRDGVLIAVARIGVTRDMRHSHAQAALSAADAVASWCTAVGGRPAILACEWPQIYTASKSKGDPNDLIAMAALNGALAAVMQIAAIMRRGSFEVRSFLPAEWIGQVPKATRGKASASPRAMRIHSRLSPAELAIVPDQHDAIDAVGIGLHALGRLGVRRAYSNGSD